jgi:hypothetical protein
MTLINSLIKQTHNAGLIMDTLNMHPIKNTSMCAFTFYHNIL